MSQTYRTVPNVTLNQLNTFFNRERFKGYYIKICCNTAPLIKLCHTILFLETSILFLILSGINKSI